MAKGIPVNCFEVLLIGGSAGSLETVLQVLPQLQAERRLAIVLIIHRRSGESLLVELLKDRTDWLVKEAEDKEPVSGGTIYIAPADYHLLIEADKTFSLDDSEKVHFCRPAIDVTFETAADAFGAGAIALLLSGANQDGTDGLRKIKDQGGYVLVQSPDDALVRYMPQYAVDHMVVDEVVTSKMIADSIRRLLQS